MARGLERDAGELRRWLKKQGCTLHSHKGGSGHLTVRLGDRTSQLPMHGSRRELGTEPVAKEDQERSRVDLMLSYPIELEADDGTVLATSRDFPELTTFGDDRAEALARAVDALEEAIAARIHRGLDIPASSTGDDRAMLPTLTAIKVILYQGMRDQGIGKAELARRLGWHLPQVDRVLDVRHRSRLDWMDAALDAALDAIGRHLEVSARDDSSLTA